MKRYKIYAGVNKLTYQGEIEFDSRQSAENYAFQIAQDMFVFSNYSLPFSHFYELSKGDLDLAERLLLKNKFENIVYMVK